jgi:hypothetical protein
VIHGIEPTTNACGMTMRLIVLQVLVSCIPTGFVIRLHVRGRSGSFATMCPISSPGAAARVPQAVAYVRDLLDRFRPRWFLCGGWAIDAWLGRQTRDHGDVDIAVLHHDQHAIFEHFAGWALVGHDPNVADDTREPWNGRRLDPPAHVHVPTTASALSTSTAVPHAAFEFEFLLVESSDHAVILNRELRLTVALNDVVREASWGLPAVAPEIVLFFKTGGDMTARQAGAQPATTRPRDDQDFFEVLPTLSGAQRAWLREALGTARCGHPWLTRLGS